MSNDNISDHEGATAEPKTYRLCKMCSIVPEFYYDQVSLVTFLSTCHCVYNMSTDDEM